MSFGKVINSICHSAYNTATTVCQEHVINPGLKNLGLIINGVFKERILSNLLFITGTALLGRALAKKAYNLEMPARNFETNPKPSKLSFLIKKVGLYTLSAGLFALSAYEIYATISELHHSGICAQIKVPYCDAERKISETQSFINENCGYEQPWYCINRKTEIELLKDTMKKIAADHLFARCPVDSLNC